MGHLSIQQGRPNLFSASRNHLFLIRLNPISQAQFSGLKSLDSVNVARYVGYRMIGPLATVYMRSQTPSLVYFDFFYGVSLPYPQSPGAVGSPEV